VDQDELLELGLLAKDVESFDTSLRSLRSSAGETELGQLQRRAMSLTFTPSDFDRSAAVNNISHTGNESVSSNNSIQYHDNQSEICSSVGSGYKFSLITL
jgi:hypothetical protein